jgi:pimeloyl-ACP methyl ester carboxylesterase
MRKRLIRGLLAVVSLLVIVAAAALIYRGWRQDENARLLAIHTPNGIEEAEYTRLGGVDQWVQIRGDDRSNPVLLIVHGGPGSSLMPMSALFRSWEKYFTVVLWDQRDAGRTFIKNGASPEMSIARVAQDGVELTEFLRRHLHKKKIVLLGHSWGTMIGVRMAKERPDLFSAYVGTGQVVSIAEKEPVDYARTMARLRAAHDSEGIAALERVGPPPYKSNSDLVTERNLSRQHDIPAERDAYSEMAPVVLFAPGWSLWDTYEFLVASDPAEAATFAADANYDARKLGIKFDTPFFIINGELDHITPTDLAKPYFDSVQAPVKQFVVLKGAGHNAVATEPDVFLRELVARVRPVAVQTER